MNVAGSFQFSSQIIHFSCVCLSQTQTLTRSLQCHIFTPLCAIEDFSNSKVMKDLTGMDTVTKQKAQGGDLRNTEFDTV